MTIETTEQFIARCRHLPLKDQQIEFWKRAELNILAIDPTGTRLDTPRNQVSWENALDAARAELDGLGQ